MAAIEIILRLLSTAAIISITNSVVPKTLTTARAKYCLGNFS
jgi:hypothetical protein